MPFELYNYIGDKDDTYEMRILVHMQRPRVVKEGAKIPHRLVHAHRLSLLHVVSA